jgi:predicted TIM-barrel fold metal-dependent hydrolase
MNTPWGDLRVVDAHTHFLSHRFFSLLTAPAGVPAEAAVRKLGWEMPDPDPARLAERWAGELDRHGIAGSVLIGSIPGDEPSVSAAVQAYPERFIGYTMMDPTAADAATRARNALASGLKGICFFPAMHRYSIQDDRVLAVLDAVRDGSCVVFVHCGVLTVGVRKRLGLPSHFDMRFSNPIDLHAVALRYPDVPFVIPHFGAGYLREALMVCDLCPNVYLDTSSSNSWIRYLTPPVTLKEVFQQALNVAGPARLLFGTDSSFFPRGWQKAIFDEQSAILSEFGCNAEDASGIFGGNLERLASRAASTSHS